MDGLFEATSDMVLHVRIDRECRIWESVLLCAGASEQFLAENFQLSKLHFFLHHVRQTRETKTMLCVLGREEEA